MQAKREGVKWENKQVDTLEAFGKLRNLREGIKSTWMQPIGYMTTFFTWMWQHKGIQCSFPYHSNERDSMLHAISSSKIFP